MVVKSVRRVWSWRIIVSSLDILLKNTVTDHQHYSNTTGTPMMWAAQNGHGNLVTLLLKNGADISKKVQNLTPLQFAVLTGNIPMFKLLVVRGAYVLISIRS